MSETVQPDNLTHLPVVTAALNKIQDDIIDIVCSLEDIKSQKHNNQKSSSKMNDYNQPKSSPHNTRLHTVIAEVHRAQDDNTDLNQSINSVDMDVPEVPNHVNLPTNSLATMDHVNSQSLTNQPL